MADYKTEYIRQKNECLTLQIGCGGQLVILSWCLSEKYLIEVQKKEYMFMNMYNRSGK